MFIITSYSFLFFEPVFDAGHVKLYAGAHCSTTCFITLKKLVTGHIYFTDLEQKLNPYICLDWD